MMPVQPGDVIASKYVVERAIVRVGAGPVLAARHLQLGQQVAIELLRPDETLAERLRRTARAAALRGEHVCRVLDVCAAPEGTPCVVTEYADGPDLSAELARRGRLPQAEAVEYALQICEGLAEALAIGLTHGALGPELVYLATRRDGSPCIKLLGLGALLDEAPPASDVRALGRLLQGMLGADAARPEPLLAIVQAACAEEYASVAELARALAPFASERARMSAERVSRLVAPRSAVEPSASVPSKPRLALRLLFAALVSSALLAVLVRVQRPHAHSASAAPALVSQLEPRAAVAQLSVSTADAEPEPEPMPEAGVLPVRTPAAPLAQLAGPPPSAAGRRAPAPRAGLPDFGGRR